MRQQILINKLTQQQIDKNYQKKYLTEGVT